MTGVRESRVLDLLPAPSKIGHVPAIDGLRAIAVLAVIVYHAKPSWLPGGLTGVDIFFAISGFVVPASILWRDFPRRSQALLFFYTRRIFRILPALVVMLVASSFAVFLFVPRSWLGDGIVQTALSAFIGTSNIVLYGLEGDYFSPKALFNPFLHTWSLGVEEQFYVAFSLVFLLFYGTRRQWVRGAVYAALVLLTVASMAVAAVTSDGQAAYAFYMLPARFWELGIGVVAYLALPVLVPWMRGLGPATAALLLGVCLAGLAMPLAVGSTSSWVAYPFPTVLPCVVATALLMATSIARPHGLVATALAVAPLRYVGLISYSLYLWHWPVFVLMRWTVGFATPAQIVSGLAASLILAVLSYHFVEQPLRRFAATSARPRRTLVLGGLGVGAAALALVFGASKIQDLISRSVTADAAVWFPYKMDAALAKSCTVTHRETSLAFGRRIVMTPQCRGTASGRTLFVVGDSHALALTRMLEGLAATTGLGVEVLARPTCAPVFPRDPPTSGCRAFADEAFALLAKDASPRDIVFFPGLRTPRKVEADGSPQDQPPPLTQSQAAAILADSLAKLAELSARKVPVILEAPQPTFGTIAFRCSDWFNRDNPDCSGDPEIGRAAFDEERRPLLDAMTFATKTQSNLAVWDPASLECDAATCRSWVDGKPMVFDGDHATGIANDRMLPSFRDLVLSRLAASP